SRPARTLGSRSPPGSTRSGPLPPSKRSTYSRSAASPRARTSATIPATASLTDSAPGASARTWAATSYGSPSARRSTATPASARRVGDDAAPPLHHLVDRARLELVRDRVGDEARGRLGDLLAHHEAVLLQRRACRGEVDDRLDEAGQRRELDRALDLDDLGLAAGVLQP